jgi:hypothetical protein
MNAALGFKATFDEDFIAGEDFATGFGQEARIGSHCEMSFQSVVSAAPAKRRTDVAYPRCKACGQETPY